MVYNAVGRCNTVADPVEIPKALPNAELLFVIPEGIHMIVSYKKVWKRLMNQDQKRKINPADFKWTAI